MSFWEELSEKNGEPADNYYLTFKRRLYSLAFHIGFESLEEIVLNTVYQETKRSYIQQNKFNNFCQLETCDKLALILILIKGKLNNKKGQFQASKIEKHVNPLPETISFVKLSFPFD